MQKIQSAHSSVALAKSWEQKGQPAWVLRCLTSALMNYLSVAVSSNVDVGGVCSSLQVHDVPTVLKDYCRNLQAVVTQVDQGKLPGSVIGGAYSHIVFAHLCSLAEMPEEEKLLCEIAVRPSTAEISTPFWQDYANMFSTLVSGKSATIRPHVLKADESRGQEKYWQGYILLMAAAVAGRDLSDALQTVDKLFADRNRDALISDDNYEIEGSATYQSKVDFRKEALLATIRRRSSP